MKNYSVLFNMVLFVAVVVLYVLHFTTGGCGAVPAEPGSVENVERGGTRVAYINTDTLLNKYQLSVELNEAFLKKQEERNTELNMKVKDLDLQASEYQRKIENNGFLSRERADNAMNDLIKKRDQLQVLQQEMTEQMMQERNELNKRLTEDIIAFLKEYNKERGYDIILSTAVAGTVLYAEGGFDITASVVQELNANYKGKKPSK